MYALFESTRLTAKNIETGKIFFNKESLSTLPCYGGCEVVYQKMLKRTTVIVHIYIYIYIYISFNQIG